MEKRCKWTKFITREIPLLGTYYSLCGYGYLEKIIGMPMDTFTIVRGELIERYVKEERVDEMHDAIRALTQKGGLKSIIHRDLEEVANNFNEKNKNTLYFRNVIKKIDSLNVKYWGYYLGILIIGKALENTKFEKELEKYQSSIDLFRGEDAVRYNIEEKVLPSILHEHF
jgi:hypothetical protein